MDAGERRGREGRHRAGRPVEAPPPARGLGADRPAAADDVGDRAEEPLANDGREDAVRVRWRGPEGREAVTSELQLLAALEVAGVVAAPDVLGIEEDGYVRETAPPLARRGGRRADGDGPPATGERLAQARAREELEILIGALHERGWVLGAPRGRGLGMRADGHVIVLDLTGLRREESLSARSSDRLWIDSVLEDEERTLRRRIHTHPALVGGAGIAESVPEPPDVDLAAKDPAPAPEDAQSPGAEPADDLPAPPAPPLRRARTQRHPGAGERRAASQRPRTRRGGPVRAVRSVLSESQNRRTALLSGGIVLVLGLGTGAALSVPGVLPGSSERVAASPPVAQGSAAGEGSADGEEQAADGAPAIEDPWALAAELAGARHAYLTGTSDVPVATAGGAAEEEDERIRAAYEGLEVRGGGPVVHEAELVRGPDEHGTAVLRVLASSEDAEVVDGSGAPLEAQGMPSTRVDLSLVWDGDRWRIRQVESV